MGGLSRIGAEMVGELLIAPPAQEDDFWSRTVVYIYEQNKSGAVGLIVNKPTEKTLSELAEYHDIVYQGDELLYQGGPVNPNALVMLHTDDWACTNTMHISENIRVSSDKTMLKRICAGDRPRKWRLFLGMSAWTTGQLEGELSGLPPWNKKMSWVTAPAAESVLFGKDPDQVWKQGIDLAASYMVQSFFNIN